MKKVEKIIVSDNAFKSDDAYAIIQSNISFLSLLLEEGATQEQLNEDALLSYYVDYYDNQYKNGNFSQFVWNSGWNSKVNELIEKGLTEIGAVKHLEHFRNMIGKADEFTEDEMNTFLESEYFGTNPLRDRLRGDEFFVLEEKIMPLNSKWIRNHHNLQVLSIDEMYDFAEEFLGKEIER